MIKITARIIVIFYVLALVDGVYLMYTGKAGGSHPVSKHYLAEIQIRGLQTWADAFKGQLLQQSHLDNATFVSITKLDGTVWKYNDKKELLDPWKRPYVIRRDNDQIIITSPGLDQYNKLFWFQKLWSKD